MNLIDIRELSKRLSVSKFTIYSWVSRGRIPYVKTGRLVRFDPDEIDTWINEHRVKQEQIWQGGRVRGTRRKGE